MGLSGKRWVAPYLDLEPAFAFVLEETASGQVPPTRLDPRAMTPLDRPPHAHPCLQPPLPVSLPTVATTLTGDLRG